MEYLWNPNSKQIYEWTEKLQRVAFSRGLVPYNPEVQGVKDLSKMKKTQLVNEGARLGLKLDHRKKNEDLREEIENYRDKE